LDALNPSHGGIELSINLSESKLISKRGLRGSLVYSLHEGRENSALKIARSSGQENVVGVPIDLQYGGFVLLDVLADPPIVILLKVANRDTLGSASNGKLVLLRAPLDVGGASIDSKNYQSGLPGVVLPGPNVSISVLGAGNDSVGLLSPVNSSDNLVVLSQFRLKNKIISFLGKNVNLVVIGAKSDL